MKKAISLVAAFAVVLGTMCVTGVTGVSAQESSAPPVLHSRGTSVTVATEYRGTVFQCEVERNGVIVTVGKYEVPAFIPFDESAIVFSDPTATAENPVTVRIRHIGSVTSDWSESVTLPFFETPEVLPFRYGLGLVTDYRGPGYTYQVERNGVLFDGVGQGYGMSYEVPTDPNSGIFVDDRVTLADPTVLRIRVGDGVNYSAWTYPVILPYDGEVTAIPAVFGFRIIEGKPLQFVEPTTLEADQKLYYVVAGRGRFGAYKDSLNRFTLDDVPDDTLVCLAPSSGVGYGPVSAARTLLRLDKRVPYYDATTDSIVLDTSGFSLPDYYGRYSFKRLRDGEIKTSFCYTDMRAPESVTRYVNGFSTSAILPGLDFAPGDVVSFTYDFKSEATTGGTSVIFLCSGYSGSLTLTEDMLSSPPVDPPDNPDPDNPDPDNPDTPGTPDDSGGNLFDKINALPEPWPVLIYIAGGCLIILALGALFGRR